MSKRKKTSNIDDFLKRITAPQIIDEQQIIDGQEEQREVNTSYGKLELNSIEGGSSTANKVSKDWINVRIDNELLAALQMGFGKKVSFREIMNTIALDYLRKNKAVIIKTLNTIIKF